MKRMMLLLGLVGLVVVAVAACGQRPAAPEQGAGEPEATTAAASPEATAGEAEEAGTDTEAADVMAFEPAQKGGTLVIGQGQEPDTLYRLGGSMLAGSHILNSIYDGPIEGLDYDYQPVILEALPKIEEAGSGATLEMVTVQAGEHYVDPESQEVVTATAELPDLPQITARFTMKEGLTWDDGTPVTADDSVFAHELACHPDTPQSKFTCDRTASYTKIDDRTVEWKGLPGFTDQTYFVNFYAPLPRHQVGADGTTTMENMEPKALLEDEVFTRKPLSYGPFKVVEWVSGDHITLERNEYYWRKDEGLPLLDSVIHRFIPDPNALLAALKTGEVDVATQDGMDINQFDALEDAKESGEITPHYVVGTVWEHIDFNLSPVDERVPLGACKELRQAIAYGTDRDTMVADIQKGQTQIQNTFVPQEHWAYPPEDQLVTYEYDAATAQQLLDDLGFSETNDQGVRVAAKDIQCTIGTDVAGATKEQTIPAGTPLELTLNTTAGNDMRQATTLLFQQNMKDIGVKVNLDYLPADVVFEDGPDGPVFGRRFDLVEFAWLTGVQPPVSLYYCTEVPSADNSWAGQNATGWCNPEYDRLGKQAENTLERAEALPSYHQAQRLFMEELPVVPLFARVKVMATSPQVVNFRPNATVNSETWNIETWGFQP
jgi:peptide/nickel transport system substrate-binding protein